jgi:hypothetical protein
MWNMPKKGFEELYEKIPKPKPSFDEVWRLTGGNPEMLRVLYMNKWSIDTTITDIIRSKRIHREFVSKWRSWLEKAVEDPDTLWLGENVPEELVNELIERNFIIYDLYPRDPVFWIDEPPPERNPELGIGKYVAWQTPLHREAVKKAIEEYR